MIKEDLQKKLMLNIGLSYCHFLKGKERLFLSEAVSDLETLQSLSLQDISSLLKRKIISKEWDRFSLLEKVEKALCIMRSYDIKALCFEERDFPYKLREIPDPPFMLFYRGNINILKKPSIAIVGTRRPTGEGINAALVMSQQLSSLKIPVVSGLAMGIDGFAHRGCIENEGLSAAVLPCGTEHIYPACNKYLAVKLLEVGGCVLSEYPPFSRPQKYRFPQRNRIISGVSEAVIVVEAPEKSGALITADFALEQGRDVFVCSSVLQSLQNAGGKFLHSQGARALKNAEEIFQEVV